MAARPKAGQLEERSEALTTEDRKIRGRIPYNVESRDMGGWTEIVEPGALRGTHLDDLVVTVDHVGVPLGRYPGTLQLEDRDDGLHWSVEPPASRHDVVEAVERGDLKAGSWRMVVGRDRWDGDVRHIEAIDVLRDVSIVTRPAYEAAQVEYRSAPDNDPATGQENIMAEEATSNAAEGAQGAQDAQNDESRTRNPETSRMPAGSLRVEERADAPTFQTLTEAFRSRGFPGDTATISFDEYRAVTFAGGTVTYMNAQSRVGGPLGADQRYLWQAVPNIAVNAGATSVDVFQQTTRTLPAGTAVVRAIDAVTAKPEVASALQITNVPMKQVAAVETNIPNVYLERAELATVVETDLRLAVNEGLDSVVLTGIATSGFQAPSTDNILVSIRKAMTTLYASGYTPDTLVLTPAASETIDTMVSGISGGTADFVFGAGNFAPGTIFGLKVVISKSVPAPVVLDSTANGRLYVSPISLARFEVDAGTTNRSNLRMEGSAAYGVERTAAAVRIAAS
jgi:HK97 family phage prohead protease